jgi:Bacterial membrane protein YfhO
MQLPRRFFVGYSTYFSVAVLLLITEAIYLPLSVLRGKNTLYGWDYIFLHARRLTFARDALFSGQHRLPGWYPRELLGTPFSANLQDFPWIPSHLPLLLLDPDVAYPAGIAMAAALAALFTYLFCRRAGLSQIGSVAAAWTFACAGFFAARVMVGHLLILEAYPSLPLLLWLADRAMDHSHGLRTHRGDTVALAIAAACVVAAGHPQLPAYSVATALLYVIWRSRGWLRAKLCGAIALGIGATMAVWWPMLLLIRRSTRALRLDPAANDIVLPYHRLLGLFAPGIDGWPAGVSRANGHLFGGYSHPGYFWDTFAYTGILPLVAAAVLVPVCLIRRRVPASRWLFLAVIGIAALLGALPTFEPLRQTLPTTILRSPARLLYLCTFSLSAAFGAGVDALLRWNPLGRPRFTQAAVLACLAFHAWDLGCIARLFIVPTSLHPLDVPELQEILAREPSEGRIAVSRVLPLRLVYQHDDAGGFDAIFLADPYRALIALTGAPPKLNEEVMDAAEWPPDALQETGVRFVITWKTRKDLELVKTVSGLQMYRVANPAPRAAFFDRDAISFQPKDQIRAELAHGHTHSTDQLWIPWEERERFAANSTSLLSNAAPSGNTVTYIRPSSDLILIHGSVSRSGVVYVLEAYDPGWTAEVDGMHAPVLEANSLGMAVPISAGDHLVRLRYQTQGRRTGTVLSVLSVCGLVVLVSIGKRSEPRAPASGF